MITIAILARNKAHTLPLFLKCIENQTYPKSKTKLYIRTNDNTDNTKEILKEWVSSISGYNEIFFDDSDLNLVQYGEHEWNNDRFTKLAKIRQDSVNFAKERCTDYFVVDCDNFIKSDTLEKLSGLNLPVVAPFLKTIVESPLYSNYHFKVDQNGYYLSCPEYMTVHSQIIKGIIECELVHCTYLVQKEYLNKVNYNDNSGRYEYVIVSDNFRKLGIPQYLDTRKVYGYITFKDKNNFNQSIYEEKLNDN